MADNYLETKMEEHRRTAVRPTVSRASRTAPSVTLRLACRHILVAGAEHEAAAAIMSRLSATGATVSFFDADTARGTRVSQSTGSRFIPLADSIENTIKRAVADRGPIESIVCCGDLCEDTLLLLRLTAAQNLTVIGNAELDSVPDSIRANSINTEGCSHDDIASLTVWLHTRPAAFITHRKLL